MEKGCLIRKMTSIILATILSIVIGYAQPDINGGWEEARIGNFILGDIAYKLNPSIYLNPGWPNYKTTPEIRDYGRASITSRWKKQYPDTLCMTHVRYCSGLSGIINLPEEAEIKEGGEHILLRPVTTFNPLPYWNYRIEAFDDFAFADVEIYSSNDSRKDSLVFHPTDITEINVSANYINGVGRYAFAYCTKLKQIPCKVSGDIMHGAFWGCHDLSITLDLYCRCDTLIADTLRKVYVQWHEPGYNNPKETSVDFPIVGYSDTLVVPKGCKEAYIGWKGIPAGVVIEGDYDAAAYSGQFSLQLNPPPAMDPIKPPLPILNKYDSHSSLYYQFDAEGMIFWERDIRLMLYKDMAFGGHIYSYIASYSPFQEVLYQADGYDGELSVEKQWYGRYTDSLGMARFRYSGFLGEDAVVPMSVWIEEPKSDTLYMSNLNTRDRIIHGLLIKKKYRVTTLGEYSFADYTVSVPLEELSSFRYNKQIPTAANSNSRLRSLKLPPTITEIRPYALAYCRMLKEHYELPKLEMIHSNALIGCRNLSISIPTSCFCQKFIADSLRKVIVKWERPNNDFPICHYIDTLVVPQGTKAYYEEWQDVTAGVILEDGNPPSGVQPANRIVNAIELIEDFNLTPQEDDKIYNLQGQRLKTIPSKGIYIRRGKKYYSP
jgi:hypothetical protein